MADNKTIIIIVAVVVVVAAIGVGAFFLLNNNNGGNNDDPTYDIPDTRMLAFGNANNDNYLDQKDVKFIQSIIDGSVTWDKNRNVLADTNTDGKIDQKDVDLLKDILAGKKTTMYYLNWYGKVRSISYPLAGNIAGSYVDIAWVAWTAGCYDDITSVRQTQENINKLNDTWYPGAASKWKSCSDDANKTFNIEKLLAQKVKVILADPDFLTDDFLSQIHKADSSINAIELPINRAVNEVDWTHTIITLGAMYNNQGETKEYVQFVEEVESAIKQKMEEVKKKYPDQTFLICYEPDGPTSTALDIFGTTAVQYGDVVNMVRLPLSCALDPVGPSGWVEGYKIEDIITLNPTVICIESWGRLNTLTSEAEYKATMDTWASYFEQTGAYKNDNVLGFAFEIYGSTPGIAGMIYMGAQIWPDVFDEAEGIEYLNEYLQNFTPLGEDFDVTENYGFLPDQWGAHID
jgi:iron complex transport system substrate-binding protein